MKRQLARASREAARAHPSAATNCRELLDRWPCFAMRSRTTKRKTVTAFINLRMKSGLVITHLNIAELNGVEIDGETKIDFIVNSLSYSFDQFKLDYTLNNKEYTLQGLMQDVQSAKKILVKDKDQYIHLVGKFVTVETRKKFKEQ
ncbi:hypothetical protein ACOSQ3_004680 [Xanthoceras sorbifolium]